MSTTPSSDPLVPQPHDLSLRRRFISLPTLLSFALSGTVLVFLLTRFDIHFDEIWQSVRSSDPGSLFLAFVLFYITIPIRGYRWRLIMTNAEVYRQADISPPSVLVHSEMILINLFANSISLFRVGDAYRAFLMSSRFRVSFFGTIGTIMAERILSTGVIFVLLLVSGIGLLQGGLGETVPRVTASAMGLFALMGLTLLIMRLFGLRFARLLPHRIQGMYGHFQQGALGSFRQLSLPIVVSGVVGLLSAARLYFVIHAFGFDVNLALVLFASLAPTLLLSIPVTPGGLGLVELGLTSILVQAPTLSLTNATAITLIDRSITYVSILVIGGVAFAIRQVINVRNPLQDNPANSP